MRNPFLQKPLRILLYAGWWILPVSIHSFVLWKTYNMPVEFVAVDSIISYTILAILGLSLWYMVRYSSIDLVQWQKLVQNHIVAMGLIFIIWMGLSYLILNLFISHYLVIFQNTIIWRLLLFLPVYLLIVTSYYLFSSQERSKDQKIRQSVMEAQIREAEFNALKAQINPHFLFNSLNSASSLTLTNPDMAREMIINISDFFRFTLMASKKPFTSLGEEVEHALLYLEIEKGRFGDKIRIESNLPQEMKSLELPSLLLQPLVENAVKHGVYESLHEISIRFNYELLEDKYKITISNDIDSASGTSKKGTATGLKNVVSRLKIAYGLNDLMQTDKSETEFSVTLWIPIHRKDNIS